MLGTDLVEPKVHYGDEVEQEGEVAEDGDGDEDEDGKYLEAGERVEKGKVEGDDEMDVKWVMVMDDDVGWGSLCYI